MATILIIEDDEVLAQMYATRLTSDGYIVVHERDGTLGLAKAKELKPDIILLDLMLPGLSGQNVLSALRQESQITAAIIVLSNLANPLEEQQALKAGANKFLVKTRVTPSEVVATIQGLLQPKPDQSGNP